MEMNSAGVSSSQHLLNSKSVLPTEMGRRLCHMTKGVVNSLRLIPQGTPTGTARDLNFPQTYSETEQYSAQKIRNPRLCCAAGKVNALLHRRKLMDLKSAWVFPRVRGCLREAPYLRQSGLVFTE